MPIDTREKRKQRAKLIHDARELMAPSEEEKRSLTAEEEQHFDKHWHDIEKLKKEIERDERSNDLEREEQALRMSQEREEEDRRKQAGRDDDEQKTTNPRATEEYRSKFLRYLRADKTPSLDDEEFRALQSDSPSAGGYLVIPEQLAEGMIAALDNMLWIRQLARIYTVPQAQSLGIRKRTADVSTFVYASELQTPTLDTGLTFGKKVLTPHHMTGEIKVSRELLRITSFGIEAYVKERMTYNAGVVQEQNFMTGNGDAKPLGLFTASSDGISTGQDVSTGNTIGSIKTDGLMEAKYKLPAQYRHNPNNRWLFHRDAIKQIAKLKDGEGKYIWEQSIKVGESDVLLGRPVVESEYAPNTFTTGLYVGLFGDGMPTIENAFARVKLA
jgi:HK97 family phage major capsid protein